MNRFDRMISNQHFIVCLICLSMPIMLNGKSTMTRNERLRSDYAGISGGDKSQDQISMYPDRLVTLAQFCNSTWSLRLKKNLELLSAGYKEIHFENGRRIVNTPQMDDKDFCWYDGAVDGDQDSHAAINLCREGISGTVYLEGLRYEVMPNSTSKLLYLTPASSLDDQLAPTNHTCGYVSGKNNGDRRTRVKRDVQWPSYYKKYINWNQLYVEMAIVFDNSVYRTAGRDKNQLHRRAKELANYVNAYFQPVNIKVALVGVEIWSDSNRITVTENADSTLDQFLRYRFLHLSPSMPNDQAQLITTVPFSGGVVGKAMKGTMCAPDLSGALVNDHSSKVWTVAATMAHEMGHNFGMDHDSDSCQCPQPRCIMAASSSGASNMYWSSCSLEHLAWGISHGSDFCLKNKPSHLFQGNSAVCGNGFVEKGEECDCGVAGLCDNPCCNASTCQFAQGAVCADGECCDLAKCQFKEKAAVCRESRDECDLAEYCSGQSEACPNDTYKRNGLSCAAEKGYCLNGTCGSHDSQCKLLWGSTGRAAGNECYALNTRGDIQGNCGFKRLDNTYTPCPEKDVMCGVLQCSQKTEKPQFGDPSLVRMAYTEIRYSDRTTVCHTTSIDLGSDGEDPGLVPNGAKCGQDKMCSGRKCIPVSNILAETHCESDCKGHGVCNNFGHCHCEVGFGGSDCGKAGLGGSVDSGPASTTGGSAFNVGLGVLIFIIVILPLVSALLMFLYKKGIIRSPRIAKVFDKPNSKKALHQRKRSDHKPATAITTAKGTTVQKPVPSKSLTTPVWPPSSPCAVTDQSKFFPKPTVTIHLQDGIVPVIAAIAASNISVTTAPSTRTTPAVTQAGPIRPKRPSADFLAQVEEVNETRSAEPDQDTILPSRRAPPPPAANASSHRKMSDPAQHTKPVATKKMSDSAQKKITPFQLPAAVADTKKEPAAPRKISNSAPKKTTTSASAVPKQEQHLSPSSPPAPPVKPLLPPLPPGKPKIQQKQSISPEEDQASYSLPEKKTKPVLQPPAKPSLAKEDGYYDVMHSNWDGPKKSHAQTGKTKEPALKPPVQIGKENSQNSTKPAKLENAFVIDLKKSMKPESAAMGGGKQAMVPPPTQTRGKVSKMAAMFENSQN